MLITGIAIGCLVAAAYLYGFNRGGKKGVEIAVEMTYDRAYRRGFQNACNELTSKFKLFLVSHTLPEGHTKNHLRHQAGLDAEYVRLRDILGEDDEQ